MYRNRKFTRAPTCTDMRSDRVRTTFNGEYQIQSVPYEQRPYLVSKVIPYEVNSVSCDRGICLRYFQLPILTGNCMFCDHYSEKITIKYGDLTIYRSGLRRVVANVKVRG